MVHKRLPFIAQGLFFSKSPPLSSSSSASSSSSSLPASASASAASASPVGGVVRSVAARRTLRLLHADPRIYTVQGFLTPSEVGHLGSIIDGTVERDFKASFTDATDGSRVLSEERTSRNLFLGKAQDAVVRGIERRAAELVGMTAERVEPLQIVSYREGQFFNAHHDSGTVNGDGSIDAVYPRRLITLFVCTYIRARLLRQPSTAVLKASALAGVSVCTPRRTVVGWRLLRCVASLLLPLLYSPTSSLHPYIP